MKKVSQVLFILALMVYAVWWQTYRWTDCRQVGHSKLYCIMAGR